MKLLKAILVLTGISILFSCVSNVSYPDAMDNAIRCMEECPDSARIYLSTLDSSIQNEPEETRMYYGLLTTKAADKKYICHKSDSLMKKVVHFYESYGDKEKLMEAYYYLGSVYRDMKDAPQAIAAFQRAADVGENSQRYDVLGRIYSQMGTLLAYQSLYEDALKIYKISYTHYLSLEEGKGLVYALRNQGRMYESLNRLDSAEYYYLAAYKKAFEIKDQKLINSILTEFGGVYLGLGKLDSAKNIFSRIPELKDNAIYLQTLAQIYQLTSQPDSAEFYYLKTLQEDKQYQNIYLKSNSNEALAKLEAQKGNYHSAFNYALESLKLEDSIKKITRTEAIGKINALYNYRHTEQENQQLLLKNKQTQIYIYLLIIASLLICGFFAFLFNYIKTQKRLALEQANRLFQQKEEQEKYSQNRLIKNRKKILEIKKLLQQLEAENEEKSCYQLQAQKKLQQVPQLKARLTEVEEKAQQTMAKEDLLKKQLTETEKNAQSAKAEEELLKTQLSEAEEKLLKAQEERLVLENKLIEFKRYEALIQKNFFENTSIYKHFHGAVSVSNLKKIKEEDWISLEYEIDKAYNNFTDRLKDLCPSINQHELRVCYLIKANIPPSGMAKIFCLSTSAISIKRSRLYHKISKEEGNGEMLDKLIADL